MCHMRKQRNDFKTPSSDVDPFYNLFDDYDLIEASFAQQYGVRLRKENDMSWDEFCSLLSGLNSDTPLGGIISIRSEKDPKKLKDFTPEQKKIRSDYIRRTSEKHKSDKLSDNQVAELKAIENAFKQMSVLK